MMLPQTPGMAGKVRGKVIDRRAGVDSLDSGPFVIHALECNDRYGVNSGPSLVAASDLVEPHAEQAVKKTCIK